MLRLLPEIPGLDERVELSVNGVSLPEFLRGLGTAHNLNLSVDPSVTGNVTYNFSNARVSDVLMFIARQYELDIRFYGSIMSIYKFFPEVEKPKIVYKKPKIDYQNQTDFLSLELKNDSLDLVAEEITRKTMHNVILAPDVKGKSVSVFIQNRPFDNALDKMALANGLRITKTSDNFYYIDQDNASDKKNKDKNENRFTDNLSNGNKDNTNQNLLIKKTDNNVISVSAKNVPISDVIAAVSKELLNNYFLYSEPKGNTSLYIENASYDEFLNYLFNGTDYTFKTDNGIYLIGERKLEGLRVTELIQLKYRTVEKIIDFIPAQLKEGIEIKEFTDLNGIIVTASAPRMYELKEFIYQIDQVVPMVLCEVMIVDIKKSTLVSTGITAGLSTTPVQTGGTVLSGVDLTLSSSSINNLISGLNGFGSINLGFVTPEFYMKIKALEENGYLKMRSTPRLATLNGHSADLTIGKTEYYLEVNNNVVNNGVNQNILQSQQYKSINADLTVKIKPFVSSDEQITLDIDVEQSDFTGKISTTAPPGTVKRHFKSMVRVKDGEMVLLGGLEDAKRNDTSTGIPLLARIPIIRWFFGNRTKEKKNDKLSIFIKTTIIY
ncbi:MAG TPA: type II and III secretion system protein [Flavobacteriales bacterium]|nr:type II and III secretion system protein [Flavobacteriales bacterium]